ncbi:MAG: N-formylglutamate amidohydrolase [Chloroflexi bacterium]|nr:N-formylglutamate amidohydrolase [Chloroflexota bacterium]
MARGDGPLLAPSRVLRASAPDAPVIAHVPHAGTRIAADARATILLDDIALTREQLVMTDWHTDRLFDWVTRRGATAIVFEPSRLVLDPERFLDPAAEPMERVGQGVVYTHTHDGRPLRRPDGALRARWIETLYRPHHALLAQLVTERLDRFDRCLVLDCHSFGSHPLPSEADQAPDRPDVCVGTDDWHTPPTLADALETALRGEGFRVRRDSPFAGALVPLDRYRTDPRVTAVMLEVRRGLYCDETTGTLRPDWPDVAAAIERACVAAGLPFTMAANTPPMTGGPSAAIEPGTANIPPMASDSPSGEVPPILDR